MNPSNPHQESVRYLSRLETTERLDGTGNHLSELIFWISLTVTGISSAATDVSS